MSRRSAVDGINGMGKHKKHKKGKKNREKQDKLERRERPGEWNLHIKCAVAIWPVTGQGFQNTK